MPSYIKYTDHYDSGKYSYKTRICDTACFAQNSDRKATELSDVSIL